MKIPWFSKKEIQHPVTQSGETSFVFPWENIFDPTKEAGQLEENSIVAAAINWAIRNFMQADLEVERNEVPVEDHPLLALLSSPNSYQSGDDLFSGALQSLMVHGNAYWVKDRNVFGSPFQLWNVNAKLMRPVGTATEFITNYEYSVNGKKKQFDVNDIVHFRIGEDPLDPRLGFSALKSVVREVAADNSASLYNGAILKNAGIPSMLFSPKNGPMTPENAEYLLNKWKQKYSKDKNGIVGFLPEAMELLTLGFSPDKMEIREGRKTPEERVCAVFGISPMVLGLSAGLERSTFSNYQEANTAAYENFILPIQACFEAAINRNLLPELGRPGDEFEFDNSACSALSEDENEKVVRVDTLYRAGIISKGRALEMMGEIPTPEDMTTYYGGGQDARNTE